MDPVFGQLLPICNSCGVQTLSQFYDNFM